MLRCLSKYSKCTVYVYRNVMLMRKSNKMFNKTMYIYTKFYFVVQKYFSIEDTNNSVYKKVM